MEFVEINGENIKEIENIENDKIIAAIECAVASYVKIKEKNIEERAGVK